MTTTKTAIKTSNELDESEKKQLKNLIEIYKKINQKSPFQ